MKVYYDYQIMLGQKFGGISRYVYEISSRLPALGAEVRLACIHNHNYYFADMFGLHGMSRFNQAVYHIVNKVKRSIDLMRGNYDIFHPTYYYAAKPNHGKLIVTVHDMTHELYQGIYPVSQRVIRAKRKLIPQADMIIAVSQNTKRDIIRFFPEIDPERISVIHHGASMSEKPVSNNDSPLVPYDYVLYVGLRGMYKNFARFVTAMKAIMADNRDIHVLCAGGGAFTDDEISSFGEFRDRYHQAGLNDEDLVRAYRGALCFVFPSEYEGFGIPVLEAFACHCPVVCADAGSLPEVAGSAALYFDPLNADDMAGKILEAAHGHGNLVKRGNERLKLFSWDRAARETMECYRKVVNS